MNVVLSLAKFGVGVTCHSSALIADAGHSLSDLFSDFVTLWAVQVARLPPDQDHPYGHGKFEAVGSLFLSLTLIGTAVGVGIMSNSKLLEILALQRNGNAAAAAAAALAVPSAPALFMAAISVVSKEWLFRVTRTVGQRLQSQIVIANAWHHRSDAYSSILATASIALAMYVPGMIFADAAAGLFVAAMIGMTGVEILTESVKQLTDFNAGSATTTSSAAVDVPDNSNEEKEEFVGQQQVNVLATVGQVAVGSAVSSVVADANVSEGRSLPPKEDRTGSLASRAIEEHLNGGGAGGGFDVDDVRATTTGSAAAAFSATAVSPPLLMDAGRTTNDTVVSAADADIESCVRDAILRRNCEVASVQGVRVHYYTEDSSALLVSVDVDIRLKSATTIARASTVARDVRRTLESLHQIEKARIFLDLNDE